MKWTDEQKHVIDARAENILVAASAGSGKTAVLVARIMGRLTDPDDPVNIDELLIVTFTKAAAGEMRERIGAAIADALEKDPDNEHLARQTQLIHNAKITTIDGFCSYLVHAYGYLTDLEPGFRVAEQGEIKLLEADTMEELLESWFAEEDAVKRERFQALVESVATGKSEKLLEDYIRKVYEAAESRPRPYVWLAACRRENRAEDFDNMIRSGWYREMTADADGILREAAAKAETNLALAQQPDGPSAYLNAAGTDLEMLEALLREEHPDGRYQLLKDGNFARLSGKKPAPGENKDLRDVFKARREEIKALLGELKEGIYAAPARQLFKYMQKNAPILDTLLEVSEEFLRRFSKKKRDRKVVDFADLEHFALEILRGKDDAVGRTAAARELAAHFKEVMCDEYQDSNDLQEEILTAVSRIEDGEDNYFCVGDVKQSIYAFRNAHPDLFMKKYKEYRKYGEPEKPSASISGVRIDLARNFRSRDEVLRSANLLFEQFMVAGVGGVDYDEDAKLICGADYPDAGDRCRTEILPVICGEEDTEGNPFLEDTGSRASREVEAAAVADRISRIVGHETVYDPKTKTSRPAAYRDIVILLRTMTGWSDVFAEVLESRGIPAFASSGTGYFTAIEVVTVLNYLRILDNPEQDIPFAAVLKSPIVGLSAEELARVRLAFGSPSLVKEAGWKSLHACARAVEAGKVEGLVTEETRGKLTEFFAFFDKMRLSVPVTPVHELVYAVLEGTGYLAYAGSLPGGAQRAANLRMLEEKAVAYEGTSYAGLSSFVRYIESLNKYEVDFGAAQTASENADTVRIISIHKSKGLEYPIVFVAGLGKSFNRQDINASLLISEKLGIASEYVDYVNRTRTTTVKKEAIKKRMQKELLGEELRVLYVAATRAKEKLILTGTVKDDWKLAELIHTDLLLRELHFPDNYILRAQTPFSLILPAADRANRRAANAGEKEPFVIREVLPSGLAAAHEAARSEGREALAALKEADPAGVYDEKMARILKERFSYVYPYAGRDNVPAKISVSELKRAHMEDEEAENAFPEAEPVSVVPAFMRRKAEEEGAASEAGGAARGTAHHRVMELLDYARFHALPDGPDAEKAVTEAVRAEIARFVTDGRMEASDAAMVVPGRIAAFLVSPLGRRFARAAAEKKLYREQPFVLFVPASEVREDYPADEEILVQGIIDAFFEEDGGIVLVDYKTDRVDAPEELVNRYRVQLDAYGEALARVTGKSVKEKIIWSFALGREIIL